MQRNVAGNMDLVVIVRIGLIVTECQRKDNDV
jgi:hypothetical protein